MSKNKQLNLKPHAIQVFSVGDAGVEQVAKKTFEANKITVGRLGEVYAAWVKASSSVATNKLYQAKSRDKTKPFSLLCPVELMQRIIDYSQVSPELVPLMHNTKLLKEAVCDKLFLAFPISPETKKILGFPDCVCSMAVDHRGLKIYIVHAISGQNSDYESIQEALAPSIKLQTLSTSELKHYLQDHLIAISSWNESGSGSNFDDFEQALDLCKQTGVELVIRAHPNRSSPHGSYGIISIVKDQLLVTKGWVRRRISIEGPNPSEQSYHWSKILRGFALNAKKASEYANSVDKVTSIQSSGL